MKRKILIIRFSSIGDIVLTTPVIRCIKTQLENVELHFLVKKNFASIVSSNPFIDKVIEYDNLSATMTELSNENYYAIIDLQKNMKSLRIRQALGNRSTSFNKLNIEKWVYVNFKINILPDIHIVDRYLSAVSSLGIHNDGKGLEYFIPSGDEVDIGHFTNNTSDKFIALVIGAAHKTKRMPIHKWKQLVDGLEFPLIIIGGKEDAENGDELSSLAPNRIFNACGKLNLHQSASVVRQSAVVIAHDTGMMHIAAAFKKPIISIWGNTVPEFGMYPYYGSELVDNVLIENKNIACRPCSKIGYTKCPRRHFKCMEEHNVNEIIEAAKRLFTNTMK